VKLRELTTLTADIENALIDSGGEITPDIEALLAVKEAALPDKVDRYHMVLDRLEDVSGFYKRKAEEFLKISKACDRSVDFLRQSLKTHMEALSISELEGFDYRFKLVNGAPKITVTDEALLPDKFKIVEMVTKPDKKKIMEAVKSGEMVPGIEVEPVSYVKKGLNTPK